MVETSLDAHYALSGDLVAMVTGTGKDIFEVALELSNGDGTKSITRSIWTGSMMFTGTETVILDTTSPTITIISHQSGSSTTGVSILLTGTYEETYVNTLTINGETAAASAGNWSKIQSLHTGLNTFIVHITDLAGNWAETGITITRLEVMNGVCGTANGTTVSVAPTINLCSVGSASSVGGS
jgi:hypothetical protein